MDDIRNDQDNAADNGSGEGAAPVILDRSRHNISRRDIDPDALKVLYRLRNHGFTAYLVGGAVRDLMLGRRPVDFDIATSARPNQIKKLFRNAFLIGRRFRLAHVRFQGGKVVEVSTFRKGPDGWNPDEPGAEGEGAGAGEAAGPPAEGMATGQGPEEMTGAGPEARSPEAPAEGAPEAEAFEKVPEEEEAAEEKDHEEAGGARRGRRPALPHKPIAFGSPAEDALRRDLTINALFYDISTFSIIDYTGGLEDLAAGRIRIIGDPDERFKEDPVRIWRVLRHAARLGFSIDQATAEAIPRHFDELSACSGARLYEELNKDLKSGASARFLRLARDRGLLPVVLGGIGAYYAESDEAFARLVKLLEALDEAAAEGQAVPQEVMFTALLEPWAFRALAEAAGSSDRMKDLHEALLLAAPQVQIPKTIQFNAFQGHVILGYMLRALETGRMRWNLKKRAQYPAASALCHVLAKGRWSSGADPFAALLGGAPGGALDMHRRRRGPRNGRHRFHEPKA